MSNKNVFEKLKKKTLKRNTKTGEYTLGEKDLDHLFGINDVIALAPNQENVASLGAITYLLGTAGYEIIGFTAVASGYLASFKERTDDDNGKTVTLHISEHESDNINIINKIFESKGMNKIPTGTSIIKYAWEKRETINTFDSLYKNVNGLSQSQLKDVIDGTISRIRRKLIAASRVKYPNRKHTETIELLSEKETTQKISETLEEILKSKKLELEESDKELIRQYLKTLLYLISYEKINIYNCDMNNLVICRSIFEDEQIAKDIFVIFSSINEPDYKKLKEKSDDELKKIISIYYGRKKYNEEEILKKLKYLIELYVSVIDNYFKYMDLTDEHNASQMLNAKTTLQELLTVRDYSETDDGPELTPAQKAMVEAINQSKDPSSIYYMIVSINNLCATDYTADAAVRFLKVLTGLETKSLKLEETQKITIPQTPKENADTKNETRHSFTPKYLFTRKKEKNVAPKNKL